VGQGVTEPIEDSTVSMEEEAKSSIKNRRDNT
jgi:hypothetical protein